MPTPTATIFLPYHALDDVILRGTRAAQPPASAVVAGTLYGVTDEGNLVERSTGTAWQAYSPTGGGGGAPAAHHVSHEPGGSDAMAVDAAAATGSLRTLGTGATQAAPGNDARFAAGTAAHHASHEPGGADALVNAAWTTQANVFTASPQQIGPVANPTLRLYDSGQPAEARVFRLINYAQNFEVDALNDAQTAITAIPLQLNRGGDALVGRDLYEKGRATPIGHWTTQDVSTYCAGFTGPYLWSLMGRTLLLAVNGSGTLAIAQPYLRLNLPAGVTLASTPAPPVSAFVSGAWNFANIFIAGAGAQWFDIYRSGAASWPTGATSFSCALVLPIQ